MPGHLSHSMSYTFGVRRIPFPLESFTELNFILLKADLRRTQAGPGRTVYLQQEQTSPNLERRIKEISVLGWEMHVQVLLLGSVWGSNRKHSFQLFVVVLETCSVS